MESRANGGFNDIDGDELPFNNQGDTDLEAAPRSPPMPPLPEEPTSPGFEGQLLLLTRGALLHIHGNKQHAPAKRWMHLWAACSWHPWEIWELNPVVRHYQNGTALDSNPLESNPLQFHLTVPNPLKPNRVWSLCSDMWETNLCGVSVWSWTLVSTCKYFRVKDSLEGCTDFLFVTLRVCV